MPSAKGLYLTAQFKISPDLMIIQDAKGIGHGNGSAGTFYHIVGVEVQVLFVGHGQNQRFDSGSN